MKTSDKSKRRLEAKKRKVSAFLQVAELNDVDKRRKILEGSEELEEDAKKNSKAGKKSTEIWLFSDTMYSVLRGYA